MDMKIALKALHSSKLRDQRGVTIVLVAILMFAFLGIAALAIDLSNLYVVRNELQNAADAGALAGARFLYNDEGTSVNPGANQIAYDAATANKALAMTGAIAVDVNWAGGNIGDVQRGHWSFATRTFTPNDSLTAVDLWDRSTESLDLDTDFINAVRVEARRQATPAASFFARILGHESFELSADAVAYIGFAGSLRPEDVDQPVAICRQAITNADGDYTCNTGRMIDSGGGTTHNTGAWTNFSQPCDTASASSVRPLVCGSGNPDVISFGDGMGTVGGMQNNVYSDLRDCWLSAPLPQDSRGYPTEVWQLTLPVVDCPGNNPGPCSEVVGTVTLNVLWIKQASTDPQWIDIPLQMQGWECSAWVNAGRPENINLLDGSQRQQCWQEFSSAFNLHTADGTSVGTLTPSDLQKTMFFLPDCEPHEPRGVTGGENFGVLARIPVLVE
jgi:Flp pilus assembly protein TadG